MKTITDLRRWYVTHSGFTGGYNVTLELFTEQWCGHTKIAVSCPIQAGSWLIGQLDCREVEIAPGLVVLVIDDWDRLVGKVKAAATRERLLVMISGCLSTDDWDKAIALSGRKDGLIRRSLAAVPVGVAYWYPTEKDLAQLTP